MFSRDPKGSALSREPEASAPVRTKSQDVIE
jgi:hypothetical protein